LPPDFDVDRRLAQLDEDGFTIVEDYLSEDQLARFRDADGNQMTPSHAVKQGTRYRYYVSRPPITKDQTDNSTGLRIPAIGIEQLVANRLRQRLLDPSSIYQATRRFDPSTQRRLIARAAEIGKSWLQLPARLACRSGETHRHRRQPDRYPCPCDTARRALRWSRRAIGG